jgi:hypothetical protein
VIRGPDAPAVFAQSARLHAGNQQFTLLIQLSLMFKNSKEAETRITKLQINQSDHVARMSDGSE